MRTFLLIFLLQIGSVYSYYYERHYEGIYFFWKAAEDAESRLDIVSLFLPDNPTIFEAGAFNGDDSIRLAEKWSEGRVISFEANPKRFSEYQEKTKRYKNTIGCNLAVNTYNGVANFYLCWGYGGNNPVFEGCSSLLKPTKEKEADYEGPTITVPCVIFDDWCDENHIEAIDFMWLDLEGFELQFLKSSPCILNSVQVIYTETNLKDLREGITRFSDLNVFLETQGFQRIAHWYLEGYQGDAIYVRNEKVKEFLK